MMGGDIFYGNTTRGSDPMIRLLGVLRYYNDGVLGH